MQPVPTSQAPRAILLDLDDTILNDGGGAEVTWHAVCVEATQSIPGLDADRLFREIARVREWYWSDPDRHREGRHDLRAASTRIVHGALTSLGIDDLELARSIANAYRDRRDAVIRPFPGAIEAVETLVARDIRLALITNGAGPSQRVKIERFNLARYFDYILIEGEFGVGKPDVRVYRAAMEALDSQASNTWMVGDNFEWEVVAPKQLGIRAVWVDHKGYGVPVDSSTKPDHVIATLHQLPGLLP